MSLDPALPYQPVLQNYDRRRYRRYEIALLGRYMLENRREFPCRTLDVSADSLALTAPMQGRPGERVIAYIEPLGRIEGEVTRQFDGGFAIAIRATTRKRDKLAATLAWLAERDGMAIAGDRRSGRIVPHNPFTQLSLPDGRHLRARILDLSLLGAAVAVGIRPPFGALVALGHVGARIVRHTDEGVTVEFTSPQTELSLRDFF